MNTNTQKRHVGGGLRACPNTTGAHVGAPLLLIILTLGVPALADIAVPNAKIVKAVPAEPAVVETKPTTAIPKPAAASSKPVVAIADTDAVPTDTDAAPTDTDVATPDTEAGTLGAPEPVPLKDEISKEKMPAIKVTVSPQKGAIGDLIEWTVTVEKKSVEDRVVLPSSLDFGKLEIQSREIDSEGAEKGMHQSLKVGLVAFDVGEFEIPPQKLTVVDDMGNISEVMTQSFHVVIESLIANEPEPTLKADEGEGEVVMVDDYTLLYVAIGLGAALLIALITLLVHKLWSMRKPKPGPPPPPPRPAHEVAFEKLNALKESGYLDEQMHKAFHLKLSEVFREYLENRYGFLALEQSTHEITSELKKQSLGVELHRQVVQLLEDTDLVKFAKYEPSKEESERLLDEAFKMVEATRMKLHPAQGSSRLSGGGE